MQNADQQAYIAALEWHLDNGVDEVIALETVNRLAVDGGQGTEDGRPAPLDQDVSNNNTVPRSLSPVHDQPLLGTPALKEESKRLAALASSLEELAQAIQQFDGLDVKKHATNFVFADGNSQAKIMLIGEAPGADEDLQGKPFVGVSGQLLDKILACIDLNRHAEQADSAIYISNILNWRPPGNRTPTPQEMEIAKPFIEKHIALINPEIIIFCGGVAAQTLLHTKDSISKLRGKVHDFVPQTLDIPRPIKAIATYHPAYLLRTPSQKAKVWQDMLLLKRTRAIDI